MESGPTAKGEVLAALGLASDSLVEPAPDGASGDAWRVRSGDEWFAVRIARSAAATDARLAAMAAARSAGLPVPDLLARARVADREAVLLSWLPGIPLLHAVADAPGEATRFGALMGELQGRLHEVPAPAALPTPGSGRPWGAGRDVPGLPDGDALLHLDWHPLNLLYDRVAARITGIVDWDNARRGHPLLDLARTASILTLEPGLATLPEPVRGALPAFVGAWRDAYGPAARSIPTPCRRWAGLVMLADLEPRYAGDTAALDRVRREVERWGGNAV